MNELYLEHHGILGQKWGVRRYQNADGTLTEAGKKRFEKSKNSNFLNKSDTSNAKRIYNKKAKLHESYAKSYSKKSVSEKENSKKYAKGTEEYNKHISKSNEYLKKSKEYTKTANINKQKIKDIDSGKIKAGKDFIVQTDYNFNITRIPLYIDDAKSVGDRTKINDVGYLGYYERKVIEKK